MTDVLTGVLQGLQDQQKPSMGPRVGFALTLLPLFLGMSLVYGSVDIKDLLPLKCRTAGVLLIDKKFNYTMADAVCQALGLQLAGRADVQKAWSFGFQTCSYGWVAERYGVISRIQNNEKCGKNQTGVLSWTVPLSHDFSAYCFNASDLRINSCKPELMVTIAPSTTEPTTPPRTTGPQHITTVRSALPTTSRESTAPPLLSTLSAKDPAKETSTKETLPKKNTPKDTPSKETSPKETEMTTPPPTEGLTKLPENQAARQSERIVFGKLPIVLLILALVFFIAAVVLAICYIKKYKTNMFFSKIKEEKESVEAKVLKETAASNNVKEEEISPPGMAEKPQNLEANAGNSMEAEV